MLPELFCNEIIIIKMGCGFESNTYKLNARERSMLHTMSITFLSCTRGYLVPSHNIEDHYKKKMCLHITNYHYQNVHITYVDIHHHDKYFLVIYEILS